jgi:hypothetical protein
MKGQGRKLSICQEMKGNCTHKRTGNHGKTGQQTDRKTIKEQKGPSHSMLYMEASGKKPW